MGSRSGNNFIIYQGENPDLEFPIVDDAGSAYDLTGGAAVLSYTSAAGVTTDKSCTIQTSTATASFDSDTTKAMLGSYPYELWCRNAAGKRVMTKKGLLQIIATKSPDAVAP
jgi:hypothetical protein